MLRRSHAILLFALAALAAFWVGACCSSEQSEPASPAQEPSPESRLAPAARPNPVIARVGSQKIYKARLEAEFARALRVRERAGVPASARWRERKRESILNDLIGDALVMAAMRDGGVTVTEAEVDARIRQKIETTFRSREALDRHLAKLGRTAADYRTQTRVSLGVERLAADPKACEPTEEELTALYESRRQRFKARSRVKLSAIVLRVPRGTSAEGRRELGARAKTLAASARSGREGFADLARRHSDGPTASRGGELGWVFANNLDPRVAVEVFRVPVGTIAGPIATRLGFQIVRVEDRRAAGVREFDEVRDALAAQITGRKARDLRSQVVAGLRKKYPVTVREELVAETVGETRPGSSQ
jgi:peptidyl-prolyl cis-trans isomerase C